MSALRVVLGLLCGIAATGPMSAVMVWLHRRLPAHERYPLPPREITTKAVELVAEAEEVNPNLRSALTWLAHFGYGGAAGMLYAQARQRLPGGVSMIGPLYGLIVWTVSYLGLLPSLRVLTPATRHPLRRSGLMIVAHLVWGWCLAMIYETLVSDLWEANAAFDASPQPHRDTEEEKWSPVRPRQ